MCLHNNFTIFTIAIFTLFALKKSAFQKYYMVCKIKRSKISLMRVPELYICIFFFQMEIFFNLHITIVNYIMLITLCLIFRFLIKKTIISLKTLLNQLFCSIILSYPIFILQVTFQQYSSPFLQFRLNSPIIDSSNNY